MLMSYAQEKVNEGSKDPLVHHSKLTPKGHPVDTYENFEWIPHAMSIAKFAPESVRSYGSPWLFRQGAGYLRHGIAMHPFSGIGQYIVGLSGAVFIAAWDLNELAPQNVAFDGGLDFLAKKKPCQEEAQGH